MEYSSHLNSEQLDAMNLFEGPCLVLAGAGSGKTRVVTYRIARLLDLGVPSSKILGLTFTNKAAGEMKARVMHLTQHRVLICTFHSLGVRILRESIHRLGYQSGFTIYDDEDTDKLLRTILNDLAEDKKLEVKPFKARISKAKNDLLGPEQLDPSQAAKASDQLFYTVYASYQEKLKEYNAVDFEDLLFLTVRLFREFPEVLTEYQDRWSFVLVDEYQDTNSVQYALIRYLVQKTHNLFVVGDPDQSIYSWRGADVRNILNFEKEYPSAKIVRLERNYRSKEMILGGANALIRQNLGRYEKNLWSDLGPGEKIKSYAARDERDEALFVTERIQYHLTQQQIPLSQMVVFYRTNFQSRIFEDYMMRKHIPYVIVGGLSFYQRKEVKDILAFLRFVHSSSDFVSFARTINIPKRGIGDVTLEKMRIGASLENLSIFAYCEAITENAPLHHPFKLTSKQNAALKDYVNLIKILKKVSEVDSIKELVTQTIENSQYLTILRQDQETFDDRKSNLDELISKADEWQSLAENPTLAEFLSELTLKSSLDEADSVKDRLNLMTLHNGKGLEFDVAFLVGMEENLFPHVNSKDSQQGLEEERRLCYVGMTRAKEVLYFTHASYRFLWGSHRDQYPSRFIKEIPLKYIEKIHLARERISSFPIRGDSMREPFTETGLTRTSPDQLEGQTFCQGDTIYHKDYGIGLIREIYQGSAGLTYKIFFIKEKCEKSIVAKYAHLRSLS